MSAKPITPEDLRAKLDDIRGDVESTAGNAKPIALAAGVAAGVVVLVGVYLLGRRKGKKRSTVVEIRRV